jgi:hypothetical protein
MIADTERLIDGFRGLPAGMDGSKEPPQTPNEAAWYATNVSFRGGNGPRTRPGFREIPPTYWRNPQPTRDCTIIIASGVATVASAGHGYDDKDKVTIAGASPAGVNGTFIITKTGSDAFTYPTTATGTVTGTITARRDIDSTYNEDFTPNASGTSTTSRTRFANDILGAIYIQGVAVYQDPREGNPTQMIVVASQPAGDKLLGYVYSLNLTDRSVTLLNLGDAISGDVRVYMAQAEKFLVIQTGQDEPRIYDGYVLQRASWYGDQVVPIGKQMAYGQGRIFVAVNDGAEIVAGDLVFGGSTTNVGVTGSTAANPTVVTTAANHGFSNGDMVTINGHSSSPLINSTYAVSSVAATTFTVPVAVTAAGRGGFAARFNAGQDSDLLRFTENTYLNEGGTLAPSGKLGRITGLTFLPVQDTATGQGDLIAFCERGAVTFQVSAPRDQWKDTQGFQRVLFDNIGSTSDSIIPVNGDLFFRSREGNGIRTYRNARAEATGYGQTPISAEIDPVLRQDTQWMLDQVSFAYFDNRLLMTCLPQQFPRRASGADYAAIETQAAQFAAQPVPTLFNGIAVLDFNSTSVGRGKAAAVFDGVWTGLRIVKLVQGSFDGDPRCFAVCFHEDASGRRVELWEVTKNDEYDFPVEGPRQIEAGIVTKAYNFGEIMSLKKLIRCDLWFDDLGGGDDFPFTCELAYRPDDYPNFTRWQSFERRFKTDFLLTDKNLLAYTEKIENAAWAKTNASVIPDETGNPINLAQDADKLVEDGTTGAHSVTDVSPTLVSGANYTFSVYAKAEQRNRIYLRMTSTGSAYGANKEAWFHLSGVAGTASNASAGVTAAITALDNGWYRCSIVAPTNGSGTTECVIGMATSAGVSSYAGDSSGLFLWGAQLEQANSASVYDPDPPQLLNYERGYAPQVRFPVPPRTANLATDVPAYLGQDFTLRVNWTGRAHLGRLMLHGNRLTEAVNGGTL